MQVTKGTWRMHEQCVPGSLSSSPAREPGNEANVHSAYDEPHPLLMDVVHCTVHMMSPTHS